VNINLDTPLVVDDIEYGELAITEFHIEGNHDGNGVWMSADLMPARTVGNDIELNPDGTGAMLVSVPDVRAYIAEQAGQGNLQPYTTWEAVKQLLLDILIADGADVHG